MRECALFPTLPITTVNELSAQEKAEGSFRFQGHGINPPLLNAPNQQTYIHLLVDNLSGANPKFITTKSHTSAFDDNPKIKYVLSIGQHRESHSNAAEPYNSAYIEFRTDSPALVEVLHNRAVELFRHALAHPEAVLNEVMQTAASLGVLLESPRPFGNFTPVTPTRVALATERFNPAT